MTTDLVWRTERRRISELVPHQNNPRKMSEKQVADLTASIEKFNLVEIPAIDADNTILAGHQRLGVMKLIGRGEEEIEVRVPSRPLTPGERDEYLLRSNKNIGEWDWSLLANMDELVLKDAGFTLQEMSIGFGLSGKPLNEGTEGDMTPPTDPSSKRGEVYELGRHRLMCGDATSPDDVRLLMDGKKAELLFTSPPYSDMREYHGDKELGVEHLAQFLATFDEATNYLAVNLGLQRKEGEVFEYWNKYIEVARLIGLRLLSWNVWVKDTAGSIGNQSAFFPIQHEWIFIFGREFKNINRTEQRSAPLNTRGSGHRNKDGSVGRHSVGRQEKHIEIGTVLWSPPERDQKVRETHPATFPVMLPYKFIQTMTNEGDGVIDCFAGSGTTLIAAEQLGRTAYLMELDPGYCDVIRKRWAQFSAPEQEKLSTPAPIQ